MRTPCHFRLLLEIHGLYLVAIAAFLAVIGLQAGYLPIFHFVGMGQVLFGGVNFTGDVAPHLAAGLDFARQAGGL